MSTTLTITDPPTGNQTTIELVGAVSVALGSFIPIGSHNDGAVISSAVTLTPPAGANKLTIQATVQNARITFDGTDPQAAKGFRLKADEWYDFPIPSGVIVKVIQEASTCDLQCQWWGPSS